jgi:hypothetical protein
VAVIAWELDVAFPPAEVAAGVRQLLADRGLAVRVDEDASGVWTFTSGGLRIDVSPLPKGRPTSVRLHSRTLLRVCGDGALADTLKSAIRLEFLRVTG